MLQDCAVAAVSVTYSHSWQSTRLSRSVLVNSDKERKGEHISLDAIGFEVVHQHWSSNNSLQ